MNNRVCHLHRHRFSMVQSSLFVKVHSVCVSVDCLIWLRLLLRRIPSAYIWIVELFRKVTVKKRVTFGYTQNKAYFTLLFHLLLEVCLNPVF